MKSPKVVQPAPVKMPDPPPTIDETTQAAESEDRLRRRRGRSSYVFGGNAMSATQVSTAQKQLTGQ